jgi:tetratricopeptide (TPR) repeat protein
LTKWLTIFIVTLVSLTLSPCYTHAQAVSDVELASHYFKNDDFEKALPYYERLYYKSTRNRFYFNQYVTCLIKTSNQKEAEKVVKKAIKQDGRELNLYITLAEVYISKNDQSSADKAYQDAIKSISRDIPYNYLNALGNEFIRISQYDYALQTFQKAQKIYPEQPEFQFRQAYVYGIKGDLPLMVESYLDLAVKFPNYLQTAKNQLIQTLGFTEEENTTSDMLRIALLKRVQKEPNQPVYNELLVWYFVQIKDFDAAFVQVKALDKKQKAEGYLVLDFGRICFNNSEYSNAISAFNYVMDLGEKSNYYQAAKIERLRALYQKITQTSNYTPADLKALKNDFISTINYVGKSSISVSLRLELAKLMAFYFHDADSAIVVLEEALTIPGTNPMDKAQVKMNLGDVMVFQNNIWEASLYYAQVEKDFKEDPIGHEAKFRKAKIFYYAGEFLLAQSQLDVLKTSTSKLIANDAFELSLLISDNLAIDTNTLQMERFAIADLLIYQNRFDEALAYFDTINATVAYHPLNDEILFKRYEIAYKQQNYAKAETYLLDIVANYSTDILADNALFKLAELNEFHLNNKEKAAEYYKQLLFNYSGSLFAVEARKRFRSMTIEEKFFKGIE